VTITQHSSLPELQPCGSFGRRKAVLVLNAALNVQKGLRLHTDKSVGNIYYFNIAYWL